MNWQELCKLDDRLKALHQEAGAYRVVNIKTGARCRTFSAERAADKTLYRPDVDFCKYRLWYAMPEARGEFGLKLQMQNIVESNPALGPYWDFIYHTLNDSIPACKHEGSCGVFFPQEPSLPCGTCGSTTLGTDVMDSPEMTAWTCQCGARRESLKRKQETGFASLSDRIRAAANKLGGKS